MSSTTDNEGEYSFRDLESGTYTLSAEATGFSSGETTGIDLPANCESRINQTLAIQPIQAEVVILAPTTETEISVQGGAMITAPTEPLVKAARADDSLAVSQILVQ